MKPQTIEGKALRSLPADPGKPARIGLVVIAGFVAVVALWGAFAPVSGAAIAAGNLQVEGQRRTVQHPYGGVVETLKVGEGDTIAEGDLLMTLSDSEPKARLDVLLAEADSLHAKEARLIAERDGTDDLVLGEALAARAAAPSLVQALANERALMQARRRQFETETGILTRQVSQLGEIAGGTQAQLDSFDRQATLLAEETAAAEQLLAGGHVSRARVRELETARADLEAERATRLAEIARSEEAIGEAELEIARNERTRLSEIAAELQRVQADLVGIGPRIAAAEDVLARTRITATATGAVVGLSVFTEGGVIQPGERILDIVPSGGTMMVEGRLHLADVQDISPGRSADIHLTGINRADRPELKGEVVTVSADRLTDERTGEGYYSIQVRMNEADVDRAGIDFQSGMPAELVMTTRSRTFVEYLLSPLTDEITRAFRED